MFEHLTKRLNKINNILGISCLSYACVVRIQLLTLQTNAEYCWVVGGVLARVAGELSIANTSILAYPYTVSSRIVRSPS